MTTATPRADQPVPVDPSLHARPRSGWLNDPNGIVRWRDRWHVFFQHNPYAAVHDQIHWGHLSSPDLATWTEHPVAFAPTPGGPDEFGCWTGVFVPGLDRPAVAYSGVPDSSRQSVSCIRYALDDELDTWGPPIVVGETPRHADVEVMRDPFVFTWQGRRWALHGARLSGDRGAVLLFSCDDIEHWEFVDVWLAHDADPMWDSVASDVWECPQLVWVEGRPVVILSLQLDHALGDVVAVEGEVVDDDGVPRFVPAGVSRLDLGDAFYAPQAVQDGEHPLLFGWILQEDRFEEGDLVAGCLSFPRRLARAADGTLVCRIEPAVDSLRRAASGPQRGPQRIALPSAAVVDVVEGPGEGGGGLARLVGGAWAVDVGRHAGTTAWVDGDVVEVYPGDDTPPSSWRLVGGWPWSVDVPEGVSVTVTALGPPSP